MPPPSQSGIIGLQHKFGDGIRSCERPQQRVVPLNRLIEISAEENLVCGNAVRKQCAQNIEDVVFIGNDNIVICQQFYFFGRLRIKHVTLKRVTLILSSSSGRDR